MAVKNFSSRVQICGRGAKCHGGHSAVEQSSYISRTTMYCEYDGQTYYPKYSEDLVGTEVLLPENAPEEYRDPSVLWNAVEKNEKSSDAQLARTVRFELPNEWTYELAKDVVRSFCQREFVDKGMCCQYAIHDSENKDTGQRNLHVHILLTMRGIDENGRWLPKQKKVYLTDENGERIPLIDKKTGQQKVDKQNRKQWKCQTIQTNDWSRRENAKIWRKDFVDTINAVNERIGKTQNFWEHRSFKEQGLDIEPQVHLGEKVAALERAGVRTIKGNINREIIANNAIIMKAREAYEQAKEELKAVRAIPVKVAVAIRNEIIDVIRAVAQRNHGRLSLPIMKGKYIGSISDRSSLQDKDMMEAYVQKKGWTTFEEMQAEKKTVQADHASLVTDIMNRTARMDYLKNLLAMYEKYEPYHKINAEYWKLKKAEETNKGKGGFLGFAKKSVAQEYKIQYQTELNTYKIHRSALKDMIEEPDKKIMPVSWKKELAELLGTQKTEQKSAASMVVDLAIMEVLSHNRRDLERMLENESHQKNIERTRKQALE